MRGDVLPYNRGHCEVADVANPGFLAIRGGSSLPPVSGSAEGWHPFRKSWWPTEALVHGGRTNQMIRTPKNQTKTKRREEGKKRSLVMSLREQTLDVRGEEAQGGALTLSNKDNGRESAGWRDVGGRRIPPSSKATVGRRGGLSGLLRFRRNSYRRRERPLLRTSERGWYGGLRKSPRWRKYLVTSMVLMLNYLERLRDSPPGARLNSHTGLSFPPVASEPRWWLHYQLFITKLLILKHKTKW